MSQAIKMVLVQYILICAATLTFYFGITQPLMVFERLLLFDKQASLLQIISSLFDRQSWPLAVLITLFSVIFPAMKLVCLTFASLFPHLLKRRGVISLLSTLSKWSMMDVLVVALLIVATKTSGLAKAVAQSGLWSFSACVILMALATLLVKHRLGTTKVEER